MGRGCESANLNQLKSNVKLPKFETWLTGQSILQTRGREILFGASDLPFIKTTTTAKLTFYPSMFHPWLGKNLVKMMMTILWLATGDQWGSYLWCPLSLMAFPKFPTDCNISPAFTCSFKLLIWKNNQTMRRADLFGNYCCCLVTVLLSVSICESRVGGTSHVLELSGLSEIWRLL